jgi:hypothetical protein
MYSSTHYSSWQWSVSSPGRSIFEERVQIGSANSQKIRPRGHRRRLGAHRTETILDVARSQQVLIRVVIPYRRFGTTNRSHLQRVKKPNLCLVLLTLEYETDRLSRNVALELPLYAASYSKRGQISSTWRRKPDTTYVSVLRIAKITQRWRQITERLLSTGGRILKREYGKKKHVRLSLCTPQIPNRLA